MSADHRGRSTMTTILPTTGTTTQTSHHHLPAGAHIADRRGLTATGAVTVAIGFGAAGAVFDVLTGSGLRSTFAVMFVLGCALAAYKVHREDLFAAVVIPPLAYVALAIVANLGSHTT